MTSMNIGEKLSSFLNNCMRVLRLAKKPSKEEFLGVAKITALGIAVIGLVGYIIASIKFILS